MSYCSDVDKDSSTATTGVTNPYQKCNTLFCYG